MASECRFCEHVNPSGAKYCNECGSPLNFEPCTECGAVNERSASHCHKCGAKLQVQDSIRQDAPEAALAANTGTSFLNEERKDAHPGGVGLFPDGVFPHAIEASIDRFAQQRAFRLSPYRLPPGDTLHAGRELVPERGGWDKLRVSRLTLSIIIAATAAIAGYAGFMTSDDGTAHSVATPKASATTTRGSDAVPSGKTEPSIEAAGHRTTPDEAPNDGGSPAPQATTRGNTISNSPDEAHQGRSADPTCTEQRRVLGLCS